MEINNSLQRTNSTMLSGYWHNWASEPGQGYKGGRFKDIRLSEVPAEYDLIIVAFMNAVQSDDRIPDFHPYSGTEAEFRQQIDVLHQRGQKVLISLGGAGANIVLNTNDEEAFYQRLLSLMSRYGFDGIDIDLEQEAITAGQNSQVIPAALKRLKDTKRAAGQGCLITLAPEFPYLATGREYNAYITALEGYYDYISPQYYNQGGDGLWVENLGWLAQNNDAVKEDFLFYLTESLATGTRGFITIPHDKLLIGLPANADAGATGYVTDPASVFNAFKRLSNAGLTIAGLMNWSVNWDEGTDRSGHSYNKEFVTRYSRAAAAVTEWGEGKQYVKNETVAHAGKRYICLCSHISNRYWVPRITPTLWRLSSTGLESITLEDEAVISREKMSASTLHGHIFSPASRAYLAWQQGKLDTGALNQRESGKFFPATVSGKSDPLAADDTANQLPPPDGKIASANQATGAFLDQAGSQWQKHTVKANQLLDISWTYSAKHLTRRWNYFITRSDWNPELPLSRAQFEDKPFYQVQLTAQPFWSHGDALTPPEPTKHSVMLPDRTGYHVILAVWEVANTGNAFYHVIDLNFTGSEGGQGKPASPKQLRATQVTNQQVTLAWDASANAASYNIYRNGAKAGSATALSYTDKMLSASTVYTYTVTAVDAERRESVMSNTLSVKTTAAGQGTAAPGAPAGLRAMSVTADGVSLKWDPSPGKPVSGYAVYRDGKEITRTKPTVLEVKETGLLADTSYDYFVVAFDDLGQLSVPGNILTVRTLHAGGGDKPYPEWALMGHYVAGQKVRYAGYNWLCRQTHVAYASSWAPGMSGAESLWSRIA